MLKSIFCTLLVVQASYALPTLTSGNTVVGDLDQLINSAGSAYVDFFSYATNKYQDLFERVLTKSNEDAETDPELQSVLRPMANFVNKMRTIPEKTRTVLQMLFNECTEIADKYDRGVPIDSSNAEHKLAKYMNEEHAMKTKFDILMQYVNSLQQFANNVRKFLNTIPEDDLERHKKLRMWYINWQREHDWEKKNDLMLKFFEIFEESEDDRSKLIEKAVRKILIYLNAVVMAHKDLFKRALETIETEIKTPDESDKRTIEIMKNFVDHAEKVHDLNSREITPELFKLFSVVQDRRRWYNSEKLTDDEKKIAKILERNGEIDVEVREIILTFGLDDELTREVEEYFDVISRDEMEQESKLRNWFEDVMDEKEYEARAGKLVTLIESLRME